MSLAISQNLVITASSFHEDVLIEEQESSSITGKILETEKKSLKCKSGNSIPISVFYFEATSDEDSPNLIGDWKLGPADKDKVASGQIIGGSTNDNNEFQLNSVVDKWLGSLCEDDKVGTTFTLTGQCGVNSNIKFTSETGTQYEALAVVECN